MKRPQPPIPSAHIVRKHHFLVRVSHWLNVPLLLGMTITGLAIYWAAPVLHHAPDPQTGNTDYIADLSLALSSHLPGVKASPTWIYDRFSIGPGQLALALRLHWFFAYLFMANGAVYLIGLLAGRGYKALLPRVSDLRDAFRMVRYYLGLLPMKLRRRPWPHPFVQGKYNALQRGAYASMTVAGVLVIASGWAMHKPVQLRWLERLFGSYNGARVWHFGLMLFFASFLIPHVVLVLADGWDTMRSMITGWSAKHSAREPAHGQDEKA